MHVSLVRPPSAALAAPWRRSVAITTAGTGLAVVAAGAALPWITLFRGLAPVPGFLLDGGFLSGLAVAAVALLVTAAVQGGGRVARVLVALAGAVVVGDAAIVAVRISAYVADPGPGGLLAQPAAGLGAPVTAAGGGLILLAALAMPISRRSLGRELGGRLALGAVLFTAGWIHLMLAPVHIGESVALGAGFLAAAGAEIGLAALVVWRPKAWVYTAVAVVVVGLITAYGFAVLVGLPFSVHDHAGGLVLGSGEPIDLLGAACKLAELTALGIASIRA